MQGISVPASYVCLSSSCSSRLSPKNKGTFAPQFGNLSAWWMTTNLVAGRISPIASLAANQETVSKTESEVEVMVEEDEIRPIILPTNESSENLLKIRHTVRKSSCSSYLPLLPSQRRKVLSWCFEGFTNIFDGLTCLFEGWVAECTCDGNGGTEVVS